MEWFRPLLLQFFNETFGGYAESSTVTQEVKLQGATTDVNGDGIVDTQDVLEIYKYIQEH